MFTIISAISELERDLLRERVIAGVRRAQSRGKHCGRPRIEMEDETLEAAQHLREQGWSLRQIARALGMSRDTLRRRLAEAAGAEGEEEPKPGPEPVAQNPTPSEAA